MKKVHVPITSENYFWKEEKWFKPLVVLNPSDFKEPEIERNSVVTLRALADQNEIIARNAIVNFLCHDNEASSDIILIKNRFDSSKKSDAGLHALPESGSNFLAFYEKENEYWKFVSDFVRKYEGRSNSNRIESFISKLKEDQARLMSLEIEMGQRISQNLHRVTKMEGAAEFLLKENSYTDSVIIGQKAYNASWSPNFKGDIPDWIDNWFFKVLGIKALVQNISNKKLREKSYRSSLILGFPEELKSDLITGARNLIFKKRVELFDKAAEGILTSSEEKVLNNLVNLPSLSIAVEFHYNDTGLKFRFLSIKDYSYKDLKEEVNISTSSYKGYTTKEKEKLEESAGKYREMISDSLASRNALRTIEFLQKECGINYDQYYAIESRRTNSTFSHSYLINIYNLPENKEIFKELTRQRNFFYNGISELASIQQVISDMAFTARRKNLPLCVPKVITDKVGINFKNLAPINMIDQNKEMVPFSFPELNGKMICLTGRHGRGKSVAGNSVLETLYLAQSGLPVFAEEFSFDVKDVIGAVINDEGHGSTATVFIQKTKNLLENIAKVPSEKSVIFIDEIGKGTQESAGLVLGKRLLDTMAKRHYSVIFNTQIMDLAKYAEQTVQAKCLKVDKNHQFSPGIGEGEMEELVKEIGLDKYLK